MNGLLLTVRTNFFLILNDYFLTSNVFLPPFLAVDFYNQVNLLYGTLLEFCTPENCPTMSAGPK